MSEKPSEFNRYGEAVLYIIESRGLNQKDVADAIKMSTTAFHTLLYKTKRPHPDTREKIESFLSAAIRLMPSGCWTINGEKVFSGDSDKFLDQMKELLSESTLTDSNKNLLPILRNQLHSFIQQIELQKNSCLAMIEIINQITEEKHA